jgi:hypothetical protein
MTNELVYVVKIFIFNGEEYEETIGICRDLKTAYNLIKEEIANRNSYLKYFEEKKWRRMTDTTVAKAFEWESEFHDDDEYYDFTITRWEVM